MIDLREGDCLEVMREMADASVDAVVTDSPYGLSFMGKGWDHQVPSAEVWREALRVLKPGGHLLAFFGSRTYHRGAVAIEDAGFEIRDQIMWVYGSGFPKSMDVSKAINKAAGAERDVVCSRVADDIRGGNMHAANRGKRHVIDITAPSTPEAQRWQGWGTALKPAHEPIVMARKPFKGTVAANVVRHGTGAINVDGCRVGVEGGCRTDQGYQGGDSLHCFGKGLNDQRSPAVEGLGRWPANLIHDGSDEVVELFPQAAGMVRRVLNRCLTTGRAIGSERTYNSSSSTQSAEAGYSDSGSAARFFYCAKASRKDRGPGNDHPTVKPTGLMRYLCRMVTPPGGVVLDPFMGSGSTGKAAVLEGFGFVGIEQSADYLAIAQDRIAEALWQ